MSEDVAKHKISLARELLDDIELSRLNPEQLLLKATRLARLVEAREIRKWLSFELSGYVSDDPVALNYMDRTQRWTDREKGLGYWKPLAEICARIGANELELRSLEVPDIHFAPSSSNPNEWVTGVMGQHAAGATRPVSDVLKRIGESREIIAVLSGVRSRVLSLLHAFVTSTYYELAFSGLAESIFEKYRSGVDTLLAKYAGDALEKIPAIYDRLTAGDPEAVSQALNTCRRVIDAFADAVCPPREGSVSINGTDIKVGPENHLNRITVYLHGCCPSASRRDRIRRTIRGTYERVSAGVHADVTLDEAKSLFLQTYLTLGEILLIQPQETKKATLEMRKGSEHKVIELSPGDAPVEPG